MAKPPDHEDHANAPATLCFRGIDHIRKELSAGASTHDSVSKLMEKAAYVERLRVIAVCVS
jgi:hypothetical protein